MLHFCRSGTCRAAGGEQLSDFGCWPLMTWNSWLAKLSGQAAAESRGSTIDGVQRLGGYAARWCAGRQQEQVRASGSGGGGGSREAQAAV